MLLSVNFSILNSHQEARTTLYASSDARRDKKLALGNFVLPFIQTAVDDGIVHGRAHGQPKARQVDLLDVFPPI